jgi:hypothetical protein
MTNTFTCVECKQVKPVTAGPTTGYGVGACGGKVCFACCGVRDAKTMRDDGRITLYDSGHEVTNWPATLRIPVTSRRKGRHNMAGHVYTVGFTFEGAHWSGRRFGDGTQLIHCRKLKARSS